MIQYPARNSFDSGNTPSVIGSPFFPARTSLASLGHARPSVETNTPESFSSLLKVRIKATFARRSSFDHLAYPSKSDFLPVIIKMYFIFFSSRVRRCFSRHRHQSEPRWRSRQLFIGIWLH